MRVRIGAMVVAAALIGAYLMVGAPPKASAATCSPADITISDDAYSPTTLTVASGTAVCWAYPTGFTNHTVTSGSTFGGDDNVWPTHTFSAGDSNSVVFNTAGTFAFHCNFHSNMHGTITVRPAAPTVNAATVPASGSNRTKPTISGTAPLSSGVNIYEGPGCATLIDDTTTSDGAGNWSYTVSDAHSLVTGTTTLFFAKTRDGTALSDCSASDASYTVGSGGPAIDLITGPPAGSVIVSPTPQWTFSAPNSTYECSLTQAAFSFNSCAGTFDAPTLSSGAWTFAVRATDSTTHDETLDTFGFTVDLSDPAIHGPKTTKSRKPKFTLSGNPGIASYECEFDSKGFVPAVGTTCKAPKLKLGRHTIRAHAIDSLGDTGPDQAKRFKIVR